jgi:cellulose synthase/poly-beta-1,6-N-acetylglucosamine synthase-like glycosyltransferase
MTILTGLSLAVLLVYSLLIFRWSRGLRKLKPGSASGPESREKLTVVVPFRNEEKTLPRLIQALARQQYPSERYEVFLVNDHSTDQSAVLAEELTQGLPQFHCIHLKGDHLGKKAAIARAVSLSGSRWILQTDADCLPGPEFLRSHMQFIREYPCSLVAGFVLPREEKRGFLEAFEILDTHSLAGVGAGSSAFGKPVMCSGANLLYEKDLYAETRKFDPVDKTASGDDMFLLIGARKLGKKVGFNPDVRAMVRTAPVHHPGALLRQRKRWGAKTLYYRMPDIQALAVLVCLSALGVVCLPLWLFFHSWGGIFAGAAVLLKLIADYVLLFRTTRLTGQERSLRWFFPVWVLYHPYILWTAAASLVGRGSWKERGSGEGPFR